MQIDCDEFPTRNAFLLTSKEMHKSSSIFQINRLKYLSIHAIIAFSVVAFLNNNVLELIVQTKSFLQVNEHRKASFHIRSLCSRSTLPRHRAEWEKDERKFYITTTLAKNRVEKQKETLHLVYLKNIPIPNRAFSLGSQSNLTAWKIFILFAKLTLIWITRLSRQSRRSCVGGHLIPILSVSKTFS